MTSRYAVAGVLWLLVAIAAGVSGAAAHLNPPLPQVLIAGLAAALIIGYRRVRSFRAWLDSLPLTAILSFHLTRFVGAYFLVLYGRGELPYAFAVPGGWGDIITAAWAIAVMALTRDFTHRRRLIALWNIWGLIDILMVVTTAARLLLVDPVSMRALTHLPLSLLPTFVVPIIIASHVLVFRRLALALRTAPTAAR